MKLTPSSASRLAVASLVAQATLAHLPLRWVPLAIWAIAVLTGILTAPWHLGHERLAPPSRSTLLVIIAGYVGLAFAAPVFSDDVYRYLLDGRLGASGIHPFAYAPDSPKIADLGVGIIDEVNHPHLHTIYPPGAQALFATHALTLGYVWSWKVLAAGAALAVALLLRHTTGESDTAMRWLLHPLVPLCTAGNGHIDVFGVLLLVAALRVASRAEGRAALASMFVGLAASVKLFPLIFAPLLRSASSNRGIVRRFVARSGLTALAVLVLGCTYAPLATIGTKTVGSLGTYTESWRFNSGPETLVSVGIERSLELIGVDEVVEVEMLTKWNEARGQTTVYQGEATFAAYRSRSQLAAQAARFIGLGVLCVVLLWLIALDADPALAISSALLAFWLMSPVVHPWYLLWLLAPSLIHRNPVGITWSLSVLLAFFAPAWESLTGEWHDPIWARVVEYVAVCATAILTVWQRAR